MPIYFTHARHKSSIKTSTSGKAIMLEMRKMSIGDPPKKNEAIAIGRPSNACSKESLYSRLTCRDRSHILTVSVLCPWAVRPCVDFIFFSCAQSCYSTLRLVHSQICDTRRDIHRQRVLEWCCRDCKGLVQFDTIRSSTWFRKADPNTVVSGRHNSYVSWCYKLNEIRSVGITKWMRNITC